MYHITNQKKNINSSTITLSSDNQLSNEFDFMFWCPLFLSLIAYSFLHVNYNLFYGDDAWTISNVWNITKLGISQDLVFIEPGGKGYDQYFGLTFSFIMGNVLNLLGWTKSNVFLVNSIFIWMTAFVWWRIIKELPFSNSVANLMFVFIPLFPPFFFAGHIGRPDAMVILIIALQLLFFIRKKYFLAAFLTGVALETHLMGLVGLFFMFAYAIYDYKDLILDKANFKSLFLRFTGGGIAALGFYFALHYNHFSLSELTSLIQTKKDMSSPFNNYILTYFTDFDWVAHVWELGLLITATTLYLKNGFHKKNRFLTILLLVMIISTIITRRENRNYLVYIFPAFMMMYFYTFEQLGKLKTFTIGLTATFGLYFAIYYYNHSSYDFEKIVVDVEAEFENQELPIIGMSDFWFAAKEREFIPIHNNRNLNCLDLNEFYFIQSDYLGHRIYIYDHVRDFYLENYKPELVKSIAVMEGEELKIWKCSAQGNAIPKIKTQVYPGWKTEVKEYLKDTFLGSNVDALFPDSEKTIDEL